MTCRRSSGGAPHAARYATKYLVKTPDLGWPEWVMQMGRENRVPRYGVSRGFWDRPPAPPPATKGKPRDSTPQTYAQRVSACGETCNLFSKETRLDRHTGELSGKLRWIARLGVNSAVLEQIEAAQTNGARRVILTGDDAKACIEAIQEAAGHPIMVISGLTEGRPLR